MNLNELFDRIDTSIKRENPFVVYRKPEDETVHALFQQDTSQTLLQDFTQEGFVFAPFDSRKNTVVLPAGKCEHTITVYEKKKKQITPETGASRYKSETGKQFHTELVRKGIGFIKKGFASKVVLSRKEEISSDIDKISTVFKKLLDHYTTAFVYVWFHPETGLWLGATPETLLKVKDNRFTTMALAGTQIFQGSADVQWPEKERREQQFVTDYILSKLKKYDLKITRPYTLQAGSLLHICTEITGILSPRNSLKDLISALHPTPAVCGVPENLAKTFILNNEHYDREYYTGYLGELNMNDKQTNLYVNLRCMKTEPDPVGHIRASLYIGGGITVDSIPEKEWEETVAKSNTIKRVLF